MLETCAVLTTCRMMSSHVDGCRKISVSGGNLVGAVLQVWNVLAIHFSRKWRRQLTENPKATLVTAMLLPPEQDDLPDRNPIRTTAIRRAIRYVCQWMNLGGRDPDPIINGSEPYPQGCLKTLEALINLTWHLEMPGMNKRATSDFALATSARTPRLGSVEVSYIPSTQAPMPKSRIRLTVHQKPNSPLPPKMCLQCSRKG